MSFTRKFLMLLILSSAFMIGCNDDEDPVTNTPDCDDGCEFTLDTFNASTGECENTLMDAVCDDKDLNTTDSYVESDCRCENDYIEGITNYMFTEDQYTPEAVQSAMILMNDGDTITFAAGRYDFTNTLSVDDKEGIIIIGAGIDETILDFSNQTAGAEGLKITANNTILANFTVLNAIGDGIKAKDCVGFSFINVGAVWEGEPSVENGAYGLYPVTSQHVLVDGCKAIGASDAGLYVGQCENVIVRNSLAENNVAGIEIENTRFADVYDNTARGNTGGLILFDLPGLPAGSGGMIRAWNNTIEDNNFKNFAEPGNVVAQVPPGTGIMIMATANVEVFDNTVTNNNLMSIGLVDYEVLTFFSGATWDDPEYLSFPRAVYVHDNTVTKQSECPAELNAIGSILAGFFDNCDGPEILWDGVTNFDNISSDETRICVQNSGDVVDLDLANFPGAQEIIYDNTPFDCERPSLPPVEVNAPEL